MNKVAQDMDLFTIAEIGDERVIVTLPNVAGMSDSEWEGSMLYGGHYIADLLRYALQHGVISEEMVRRAIDNGIAARQHQRGQPQCRVIPIQEFERLLDEFDQRTELAHFDHKKQSRH